MCLQRPSFSCRGFAASVLVSALLGLSGCRTKSAADPRRLRGSSGFESIQLFQNGLFRTIGRACDGGEAGVCFFRSFLMSDIYLGFFGEQFRDPDVGLSELRKWQAVAAVEAGWANKPEITELLTGFYYDDTQVLADFTDEEAIHHAVLKLMKLMTGSSNEALEQRARYGVEIEKLESNTAIARSARVTSPLGGVVFRTVLHKRVLGATGVWIPVSQEAVGVM